MVWDTCNIVLHNGGEGQFYTQNVITGTVVLEFKKEKKVQQIDLKIFGISEAKWSRFSPALPYLKVYSEKLLILNATFDIFNDICEKSVQPGIYTYQFHLLLQEDLPSTFKDSIAKIKYYAMVQSSRKKIFHKKKVVPFTVLNSVDLNESNDYKVPVVFEATKNLWNGEFSVYIKTYKGFAPKQKVPIEIMIQNGKKARLSNIKVTLIQKLEYRVSSGFCNDTKRICSAESKDILNSVKENVCIYLDVPWVVPSSINTNDPMVKISYVLEVKVGFVFHFSLYSDIPVTIATVPVEHSVF